MDEYFCPNCGAILNDQYGFDPSCGTWTCTACGKHLMDDDVYEGDTFEGVAWYCDNCGTLLNRQPGFSDSYGSWTCTECGHKNGTTEEDIIDDTVCCPNCGSSLNNQSCFDKYYNDWTCTSCGAHLHHSYSDDEYTVVEENKPTCPQCGSILTDQWGFSKYDNEWKCSSCGAQLRHDYSDEDYSVVEKKGPECPRCGATLKDQFCFNDYEEDWECTECGAHLHHDYSCDPYIVIEEDNEDDSANSKVQNSSAECDTPKRNLTLNVPSGRNKIPDSELRKQRIKAFLFKRKKVQIGFNYFDLLGKDVDDVQTALHNRAFKNIKVVPVKDICEGSPYRVGDVAKIEIGGVSRFEASDTLPYDTDIIIAYHEKKEITIPFSARSFHKHNYVEVGDRLQELGFTEIYERPIEDLVTGWIKKNGSVERVIIDGNDAFKKNSVYTYDVKIVIEYHTFK